MTIEKIAVFPGTFDPITKGHVDIVDRGSLIFDKIIIEFYTKLEPLDRKLKPEEAQKISGLTDLEFLNLIETSKILAATLYQEFQETDFILWDGKFEFAFGKKLLRL